MGREVFHLPVEHSMQERQSYLLLLQLPVGNLRDGVVAIRVQVQL